MMMNYDMFVAFASLFLCFFALFVCICALTQFIIPTSQNPEKHLEYLTRENTQLLVNRFLTSLYFTLLHFTSLYFTLLHFTSLYFTLRHFTSLNLYPGSLTQASHFVVLLLLFAFLDYFLSPSETAEIGRLADLPRVTTRIPREKHLPAQKAPTKWKEFAKLKGIQKRKRTLKVFYT